LKILAVTVLTSFDPSDMEKMGMKGSIEDLVLMRAKKAVELGCDGIVASAREAARLRKEIGPGFIMVTPGIRPAGTAGRDDQRRIATPSQAIRDGADYLVIGRPIRDAADPLAVARGIKEEISYALKGRD
jgi:orotidine-5'-phosphate decarboxylase